MSLILDFSNIYAQEPDVDGTLLWKITGNGTQKPSYMYGTMHVRDKRVFNFADSVLFKLDECEAFALEVDPDSVVNSTLSNKYNSDEYKLRAYLGDDEYKQLQKDIGNEAGMNNVSLENQNPLYLKNFVNPFGKKSDDMPTFLDAYLYNISRQNGKKFVPLEDVQDQMSLLGNLPHMYAKEFVKEELGLDINKKMMNLLDVYLSADLNKIDIISRSSSHEVYENMFVKRNRKMCSRIDNYMHKQSTFFAMGAGHLPGKDGLITLLRQKGYTVSPVRATYTGMALRFKSRNLAPPWITLSTPEEGYSVDMPVKPLASELYLTDSQVKSCVDVGTGLFYFATSYFLAENGTSMTEDEKAKTIVNEYWKKKDMIVLECKKVPYLGTSVREYLVKNGPNLYRPRIIFKNNMIYIVMVGGNKQAIYQPDAERFFNSVHLTPPKPKNWEIYTSNEGAFEVFLPVKPQTNQVTMPLAEKGEVKMHMVIATDNKVNVQYLVQYFEGNGLYYPVDSAFFGSAVRSLGENMKADSFTIKKVNRDGFDGEETTYYLPNNTLLISAAYLRGCRAYNLIASLASKQKEDSTVKTFFESFHLKSYQSPKWQSYALGDSSLKVMFPSEAKSKSELNMNSALFDSSLIVTAIDENSGYSFYLQKSFFNKFFSAPDYDSIFSETIHNILNENDSLLSSQNIRFNNIPGRDFILQNKQSHNLQRYRALLNDSCYYLFYCYIPPVYAGSEDYSRYFESMDFKSYKEPVQLLEPKTCQLLTQLQSPDSAKHAYALNSLYNYPFTNAQLPRLYNAALYKYPADTGEYCSTRNAVFSAIESLADSTYLDFILEHYDNLDNCPSSQMRSLEVLAGLKTAVSRKLLLPILLEKAPAAQAYSLFYNLQDSMELNTGYYPDILELASNEYLRSGLFSLTVAMLEKKLIDKGDIRPFVPMLLQEAKNEIDALELQDATEYYDENLLKIIGWMNTPECNAFLMTCLKSKSLYVKLYAAVGLIRNGENVKGTDLLKVASNAGLRSTLYDELIKVKRSDLFPRKYNNQKAFAESNLWNYFANDDGEPSQMVLKDVKDVVYHGEIKRFYLYKVKFAYDKESYVYFGVSGPYPVKEGEIITEADLTGSSYDNFDDKTPDEHLKEYLKGK